MFRKGSRGVALVFVILVLLILGGIFSGVTFVNYIKILRLQKDTNVFKARMNALFALDQAVAQLQNVSGVDTCVTANAGFVAGLNNYKRHYVGSWRVAELNEVYKKLLQFSCWLCSDENAENFDSIFSSKAKEAVNVFSFDGFDGVFLSPIEIKIGNKIVGNYGFWVSDESQKAKINLVNRYKKSGDFVSKKVKYCCPQGVGIEKFFGVKNHVKDNFIMTKVDFPEQLRHVDTEAFDKYLENKTNLTLHSYGVLSATNGGGLRDDLTHLAKNSLRSSELLFDRQTDMPAYVPKLQLLLSFFYEAYKNTANCVNATAMYPMFRPQFFENYGSSEFGNNDLQLATEHGNYPLLAQAIVNFGLAEVSGKIVITVVPQVVIWNPYNVDFAPAEYSLELCVPHAKLQYNTSLTIFGNNNELHSSRKLGTFALQSSETDRHLAKILKLNFSTGIKAGEVKIFSLQNAQAIDLKHGNMLANGSNLSQFLYIETGVLAGEFSSFKLIGTDEIGKANADWNCFYWRLIDGKSSKVLQEIAELDPLGSQALEREREISSGNNNYFSLISRMCYGIRDDASGKFGVRWLASCNPRAQYVNRSVCQGYSSIFFQQNFASNNWSWKTGISINDEIIGVNADQVNYLSGLILFDMPERSCGVLNIGYLRHANLVPFGYFSSQIIGSSRANPLIPLNEVFHKNSSVLCFWQSHPVAESLYDYSYLLNDILFDRFFVSTAMEDSEIDENLNFLVNKRFKLLNKYRMSVEENLSEILLIDGPFNINSCNENVWACILSSTKNDDGESMFPRFYSDSTIKILPSFSDAAIDSLAERIVKYSRLHENPYASIGEFTNRSVDGNIDKCSRVGVLQQAIDDSRVNSNSEKNYIKSAKNIQLHDDNSASGYLEENLPSVINQGDILQNISHFISARGDTFLVRAFGDCVDANGKIVERAYCEAIVQRVPEYIDSQANSSSDKTAELSDINKRFGRRFKTILFRWLDEDNV